MKIYIVRHGQTEENLKGTYYGSLDCSLTRIGEKQGVVLGDKLKDIKFDKVYCSSLIRAKDTLKYIYFGDDIIIDNRLNERNFGIFEGKTFRDIEKELSDECKNWINDWIDYKPLNGESFREVYLRVVEFMEQLKQDKGENILICTHGGIVKAIYLYILGGDLELYWKFNSRNADLSIIKNNEGYFYIDSIIPIEL